MSGRQCSLPLQRVVTDFGADHAFGQVPNKLNEHYGIEVATSTIAAIAEYHADKMIPLANKNQEQPNTNGSKVQIGEIDGSMVPTVTVDKDAKDKRKNKTLAWKEVRLSIVHEQGTETSKFGAVYSGNVDDAGQTLLNAAIMSGFGKETYLHSVGDGATWIASQVENKFGAQGHFIVDMYHVCEYLSAASVTCSGVENIAWVEVQKNLLKENKYKAVLNNLKPYIENDTINDDKAPVRKCYRYLYNRRDQLDYKTAIDNDLPIGSGEIESAHRYVIQKRLKLSGAWWTDKNIDAMLALRVVRANEQWSDYWESLGKAA